MTRAASTLSSSHDRVLCAPRGTARIRDHSQRSTEYAEDVMKPSFGCWLAALSIPLGSLVAAQPVAGQHAEKTYTVGILCGGCSDQDPGRRFADTRQALRERGYVEGRNIAFVYRSGGGSYDKLPGLAADLVRAKVDVIMAGGGLPGALAAK